MMLLAGAVLVCASSPYTQSDATAVSQPKDEIVTITVNIDAPGLTDEEAKNWKNNAESAWNRAFDQWPAQCFKLHLDVKINPQPALRAEDIANGHPRPGHHLIYRASFARAHGAIVSGVKTGQAGDTTYPLQNTTWGAWGPDVDLLQGDGYAHEVGHLMGLGDDYIDHPATSQHARWTEPKPGRKNTLMADGGPVDKQLVDRLTKLLRQAGKLPSCGLKFGAVRFDWRPEGAYYYDDISGRVCGDPFGRPWDVSWTVTNWIDPNNTGSIVVHVSIPGAGVETAGTGSPEASYLHLTFLAGPQPHIKVTRFGINGQHHEATVPLEEDKTCSERKGVS